MTEKQYFLHLAKSFINGTAPQNSENIDTAKLMRLANIHTLSGMVCYMADKYSLFGSDAEKYKSVYLKTVILMTKRDIKATRLFEEFEKNGIDYITFKGYVVKNYYPVSELRTYGDIDFAIKYADREKSHKLMLSLGYECTTDYGEVYSYRKNEEYYEIHTSVMTVNFSDKADFIGYFKEIYKNTLLTNGQHGYQFTPQFHFIYLLCHIAKHIYGEGAGIRMYMDIALFIKRFYNNNDIWDGIARQLEGLNLTDFADTVFSATEEWFGISPPLKFNKKDIAEFTEYTLEGGTFGFENTDRGVSAIRQSGNGESKAKAFFGLIFPSADKIEARYTFLKDRHYLLPVAWAVRFFATFSTRRENMQRLKNIADADIGKAQKQRDFLKGLGL